LLPPVIPHRKIHRRRGLSHRVGTAHKSAPPGEECAQDISRSSSNRWTGRRAWRGSVRADRWCASRPNGAWGSRVAIASQPGRARHPAEQPDPVIFRPGKSGFSGAPWVKCGCCVVTMGMILYAGIWRKRSTSSGRPTRPSLSGGGTGVLMSLNMLIEFDAGLPEWTRMTLLRWPGGSF